MNRDKLVNGLAIAGTVAIVVGIGMLKLAAGVIALGVLLIVGAVAVARLDAGSATTGSTKAKQ